MRPPLVLLSRKWWMFAHGERTRQANGQSAPPRDRRRRGKVPDSAQRLRRWQGAVERQPARGLHAAIRIAVGTAEQRNRDRHLVETRRRPLSYYESTP
jgi:hypothetical protein